MSRLTPEEQREYEEEAEYSREHQTVNIPAKSAYQRIKESAAGRAVISGVRAGETVAEAVDSVGRSHGAREIREYGQRMNSSDTLGGSSSPPRARAMRQQPQVQVNQGSSLHPGNRIYVMEGSIIASGGAKAAPRQSSGKKFTPGFGNDPGM